MSLHRTRVGIDAWTTDGSPAANTGEGKWLRVQDGTPTKYAWIHFKNPAPNGATILTGELHLFDVGSFGSSVTIHAKRADGRWSESGINFNTQPGVTGTTVTRTQTSSADAAEWVLDVAAHLQTMCDGAANYGWRLDTTDTTERKFYSLNADDNRPYLLVEWADEPDAPTELSPAGGSAVSISKPTFTFNFHDVSGETRMAALRLQINATNTGWTSDATTGGFASPDFDTETDSPGGVASHDPEYDSSTGTFGGITAAATKWWTVQVQDAAGLWSDWSEPAHFTRVARGTLTIGSPAGSTVSDPTQTIIWSLSGATQIAWSVTVWDDSDPGEPIYSTGRRAGTATSWTLPKGVVNDEGIVYRLRVRVWDEPLRVQTPGDPIHTEVVTTFHFVEDPTPNAPASVNVAQVNSGQPHIKLDIVRSSAPDFFTIVRNGKILDTDVVPADIFLSGTTYRYIDRTAVPNVSYTYKVRSKVSGVVGPARTGSPDPFTYRVGEVWLLDWTNPGSSRLVPIVNSLGDDTFDMPELGAVYAPVDGDHVIAPVQSQRGLEGHIEGRIVARAALSAAASVADMLYFKAHPANDLRMVIGGQNLRVVVRNVVVSPLATGDIDARHVALDFYSLDGPTQN
jgi:hypothetical protein